MDRIRALVLSGGGGRGAFHAGVYKYLMQPGKQGVDSSHTTAWEPQVVVGTSIGAVNGAANPLVGTAPAEVAIHGGHDLRIRGIGVLGQERSRLHDLA